jgi:PIN domain nuclease of toxin-antitoxin system
VNVFDASTLLAFLGGEPGADVVESVLGQDGRCGAANWSETAQKVAQRGADWALAKGLLLDYGLGIEPVTEADAERAARLWSSAGSLSLGDRLCLALAGRLDATVWTADAAWGESAQIRQVRAQPSTGTDVQDIAGGVSGRAARGRRMSEPGDDRPGSAG